MQIEKLNENQLKITLNTIDLQKSNISLHSFMCNSIESKGLFTSILNYINKEINFNLNNYEVAMESFAFPLSKLFVVIITRIPRKPFLHISKKAYNKMYLTKSFWAKFDSYEDFCEFCFCLNNNLRIDSTLFLFNKYYFLHIKFYKIKDFFKFKTFCMEFASQLYNSNYIVDENAELITDSNAIEIGKKYMM